MFTRAGEASSDANGLDATAIGPKVRLGLADLGWLGSSSSLGSWCATSKGGDREGENSRRGKIGSTLEVSGVGEPGRVIGYGGGVVDNALGLG